MQRCSGYATTLLILYKMERVNKSKSYVLPLLSNFIEIKNISNIVNSYLFLEGKDDKYIIVKYRLNDETLEYVESIKSHCLINNIIENGGYLYIVFNVPNEILKDYEKFVDGKYSEIESKNTIITFLSDNYPSRFFNTIERIRQVLYKDKALKYELEYNLDITLPEGIELSSKPDLIDETLII